MRALTTVGLALLTGAAGLEAQHAREYEFSMFGSYTKYDASFNLAKKTGGGVRLGYAFGDRVGLEADVLFQPEYTLGTSNSTIEPLIGGVSLVVNLLHGAGNSLYVLGGYSLLDFGATAPYKFTDGGIHGGVGDRIFLTRHLALRLEARAIYTPDTKSSLTTNSVTHLVGSAGLAIFAPGSKRAAAPPAPPPAATPPPVAAAPPTYAPASQAEAILRRLDPELRRFIGTYARRRPQLTLDVRVQLAASVQQNLKSAMPDMFDQQGPLATLDYLGDLERS